MVVEQSCLFQILDLIAPPELAEPWDNVGPQIISDSDKKISKIILCLDCCAPVIKEALKIGAELIISHHPLIFSPLSGLVSSQYPCNLIHDIIRSGISLFVMHSNLDKAAGGVNDCLARMVGLDEVVPLARQTGTDSAVSESGLGRIGNYPVPKKLGHLCNEIKGRLGLSRIRFVGDSDMEVSRMAVCSGSGADLAHEASKKGANAFLTGDVKYHQAREAQAHGIALIDAGHFATERIILPALKEEITRMVKEQKQGDGLEIFISSDEKDPFQEL